MYFKKIFGLLLLVCAMMFSVGNSAEATIGKGYAPIMNGDLTSAKAEAKKQAMKDAIEQELGVRVQSTTETANFMMISQEIVTKSDGYAVINRVIKDEPQGELYYVELDLTISADRVRAKAQDLFSLIQNNVNDSNSRGGIQVAVVSRDSSGRVSYDPTMGDYVGMKLKQTGFDVTTNDSVVEYMINHYTDADIRIQARRIARENRESENALLRGVLAVDNVRRVGGLYEARVKASFELIGIDSNNVDVFSKYFVSVGKSEFEAVESAKDNATQAAMEELGKQALMTVQAENQGGVKQIKIVALFANASNVDAIESGLQAAKCQVVRISKPNATTVKAFIVSDSYPTIAALSKAIRNAIPGLKLGDENSERVGSTQLSFTF